MIIRDLSSGHESAVLALGHLLDGEADPGATRRFLADGGHHLLVAYEGDEAIGFVSGVQMTHPDKGTEMFLYELGVADPFRRRGVARALVTALAGVARSAGCYGMWVLTDADNEPARRTYAGSGAEATADQTMFSWTFTGS